MSWFKKIALVASAIYFLLCFGLYFFQEKLLFHPPKLPSDFQFSFAQPFEESYLTLKDGSIINLVKIQAEGKSKGIVLFFHGNAGDISRIGWIAKNFTSRGYDCLIMDYPKYGKSTGRLTEDNLYETASVCFKEVRKTYSPQRIVLYGRSLGTGVAAHLAREVTWCQCLILEAPYNSIVDVAANTYWMFPVRWLCRYKFMTQVFLKDVQCPVYAIHGSLDKVIPVTVAKKLEALHLKNFQLTVVPGGGHANLPSYPQYANLLNKALE